MRGVRGRACPARGDDRSILEGRRTCRSQPSARRTRRTTLDHSFSYFGCDARNASLTTLCRIGEHRDPVHPRETKSIGHVLPNALEPHIAISHGHALDILSRALGLSEDHGGGTPGSVVWILTRGLSAYREVRPANPIDQLWPGITPAAALEKLLSNPSEQSVATTA